MLKTQEQFNRKLNIAKFRVKIKSLAAEAKIIKNESHKNRQNILKSQYKDIYWLNSVPDHLRTHNIHVVRREQRHTLLAYAFYRGIPYRSIDGKFHYGPSVEKISRILKSLTGKSDRNEIFKWYIKD